MLVQTVTPPPNSWSLNLQIVDVPARAAAVTDFPTSL